MEETNADRILVGLAPHNAMGSEPAALLDSYHDVQCGELLPRLPNGPEYIAEIDVIHLNAKGHEELAAMIATAVPEPSSMLLSMAALVSLVLL